jgi:hypothetical protein
MVLRSLAIWLLLIAAEVLHGIARAIFLVPHVGEFRSNQLGVFTGSLIILVIALLFVRWLGATRSSQLLGIGVLWLVLTLAFEFLFGHFVIGASWERLLADYNVPEGGLLPFGMVVLTLSPWIAGKVREIGSNNRSALVSNGDFKSPEELDAFIIEVSEKLRTQGQTEAADVLASIRKVAFTTGSEWLGELGLLVRRLHREFDLDASIRRDLKRIMRSVKRVWPRL